MQPARGLESVEDLHDPEGPDPRAREDGAEVGGCEARALLEGGAPPPRPEEHRGWRGHRGLQGRRDEGHRAPERRPRDRARVRPPLQAPLLLREGDRERGDRRGVPAARGRGARSRGRAGRADHPARRRARHGPEEDRRPRALGVHRGEDTRRDDPRGPRERADRHRLVRRADPLRGHLRPDDEAHARVDPGEGGGARLGAGRPPRDTGSDEADLKRVGPPPRPLRGGGGVWGGPDERALTSAGRRERSSCRPSA